MIVGVIADDLTGAADSAAPYAARGLTADVQWVSNGKLAPDLDAVEARAWCTGTRDLPADREIAIRRLTRAATRRLKGFSPQYFYKKIDSTLRGYLRMELDAMRLELRGTLAVVCPAFPANGRTVRDGTLYVHGEARQRVRAAFGMEADPLAMELTLEALRSEPLWLTRRWRAQRAAGVHTIFCDAETDADLDAIAGAALEMGGLCLPVGSAGFSAAIAARLPAGDPCDLALGSARRELAEGPVAVIVGSLHSAARRQADRLAEWARIDPIVLPAQVQGAPMSQAVKLSLDSVPLEIVRRFEAGDRIVLLKTPSEENPAMRASLGALVYYFLLPQMGIDGFGLVVTGGDTAQQLVQANGAWRGIRVVGEFEPGVVAGRILGSGEYPTTMDGRPIVLKSGGFGDDDTLVRCVSA